MQTAAAVCLCARPGTYLPDRQLRDAEKHVLAALVLERVGFCELDPHHARRQPLDGRRLRAQAVSQRRCRVWGGRVLVRCARRVSVRAVVRRCRCAGAGACSVRVLGACVGSCVGSCHLGVRDVGEVAVADGEVEAPAHGAEERAAGVRSPRRQAGNSENAVGCAQGSGSWLCESEGECAY
jgi:hypothetical protein